MAVKSLAQTSILQPSGVNSLLGDYESNYFHHLETVRLGGSAASVTFSNLAQYSDYQHLQIRYAARTDRGTYADDVINMTFNSDTTSSNYKSHALVGGGTSGFVSGVNSQADWFASTSIGITTTNVSTSGNFGVGVIDLLDPFESTKFKTSRASSGFFESSNPIASYSACRIYLTSQLWRNTNALTSINLGQGGGSNFVSGSRFSLYGIKARS